MSGSSSVSGALGKCVGVNVTVGVWLGVRTENGVSDGVVVGNKATWVGVWFAGVLVSSGFWQAVNKMRQNPAKKKKVIGFISGHLFDWVKGKWPVGE